MLPTKIWIFNPASSGAGQYTADLYFLDATRPQYVRLGDRVQDTAGNEYELVSATLPFSDGGAATLQFITQDVPPVADSDYNSDFYTPGQVDIRPQVHTAGDIFTRNLYSGPDYEYSMDVAWAFAAEEAKAVVGDRIVDANGKEFEITFIDPTQRFAVACRAKEVEAEGVPLQNRNVDVFRNGILQRAGASHDYTLDTVNNKVVFNEDVTENALITTRVEEPTAVSLLDNHFDVGVSGQSQFVCSNGTVNQTNRIEVWANGLMMREGASYDWQRNEAQNAIDFNYTVPENRWVLVRIYDMG